jgi:hypothetical protein
MKSVMATFAWSIGVSSMLAACTGSPAPAPAKPAAVQPVAGAPQAVAMPPQPLAPGPHPAAATPRAADAASLVPAAPAVATAPPPSYETKGRRDPFEVIEQKTPTPAAAGLAVASAKLTGIVQGDPASLALVETQDGIGYILRRGDTLGDGRLTEIGADSVVFTVTPKTGSTTSRVVLRLAAN